MALTGALMLFLIHLTVWAASEPKSGGVLTATQSDPPPSLNIHEEATVAAVWPMMLSSGLLTWAYRLRIFLTSQRSVRNNSCIMSGR